MNNSGYSTSAWHSFKPDEKAYVHKLREEMAGKRSVSAVNSIGEHGEDKRQRTEEENTQEYRRGAAMSRPGGSKP